MEPVVPDVKLRAKGRSGRHLVVLPRRQKRKLKAPVIPQTASRRDVRIKEDVAEDPPVEVKEEEPTGIRFDVKPKEDAAAAREQKASWEEAFMEIGGADSDEEDLSTLLRGSPTKRPVIEVTRVGIKEDFSEGMLYQMRTHLVNPATINKTEMFKATRVGAGGRKRRGTNARKSLKSERGESLSPRSSAPVGEEASGGAGEDESKMASRLLRSEPGVQDVSEEEYSSFEEDTGDESDASTSSEESLGALRDELQGLVKRMAGGSFMTRPAPLPEGKAGRPRTPKITEGSFSALYAHVDGDGAPAAAGAKPPRKGRGRGGRRKKSFSADLKHWPTEQVAIYGGEFKTDEAADLEINMLLAQRSKPEDYSFLDESSIADAKLHEERERQRAAAAARLKVLSFHDVKSRVMQHLSTPATDGGKSRRGIRAHRTAPELMSTKRSCPGRPGGRPPGSTRGSGTGRQFGRQQSLRVRPGRKLVHQPMPSPVRVERFMRPRPPAPSANNPPDEEGKAKDSAVRGASPTDRRPGEERDPGLGPRVGGDRGGWGRGSDRSSDRGGPATASDSDVPVYDLIPISPDKDRGANVKRLEEAKSLMNSTSMKLFASTSATKPAMPSMHEPLRERAFPIAAHSPRGGTVLTPRGSSLTAAGSFVVAGSSDASSSFSLLKTYQDREASTPRDKRPDVVYWEPPKSDAMQHAVAFHPMVSKGRGPGSSTRVQAAKRGMIVLAR